MMVIWNQICWSFSTNSVSVIQLMNVSHHLYQMCLCVCEYMCLGVCVCVCGCVRMYVDACARCFMKVLRIQWDQQYFCFGTDLLKTILSSRLQHWRKKMCKGQTSSASHQDQDGCLNHGMALRAFCHSFPWNGPIILTWPWRKMGLKLNESFEGVDEDGGEEIWRKLVGISSSSGSTWCYLTFKNFLRQTLASFPIYLVR